MIDPVNLYILTGHDGFTSVCNGNPDGLRLELDRRVWTYPIHVAHWARGPRETLYGDWFAVKDWIITWP